MIQEILKELLGLEISLEKLVNSRTLVNVIPKDSTAAVRRPLIDIFALKESYRRGEVNGIVYVPGNENALNVLKKEFITRNSAK